MLHQLCEMITQNMEWVKKKVTLIFRDKGQNIGIDCGTYHKNMHISFSPLYPFPLLNIFFVCYTLFHLTHTGNSSCLADYYLLFTFNQVTNTKWTENVCGCVCMSKGSCVQSKGLIFTKKKHNNNNDKSFPLN